MAEITEQKAAMPPELATLIRTPVPKRPPFDAHNYLDGTQTKHDMEGTVVPPAASRRNVTKITKGTVFNTSGSQGVTFDINKPLPYNVVDLDSGRTIHVSPEDHAIMTKVNQEAMAKGEAPVSFEQLEEMKLKIKLREELRTEAQVKEAIAPPVEDETHPPEPEMPGLLTPDILPARKRPKRPTVGAMEAQIERKKASEYRAEKLAVLPMEEYIDAKLAVIAPTEKVRFSGAFGALSVIYNTVRRDGICLILTQYSAEGAFYEAPSGRDLMTVEHRGVAYQCYPGPQFLPFDEIGVRVSVFFIEE